MKQIGNLNEMGQDDTKTWKTALVVQLDQHINTYIHIFFVSMIP